MNELRKALVTVFQRAVRLGVAGSRMQLVRQLLRAIPTPTIRTPMLGAQYDTSWARRPAICAARSLLVDTIGQLLVLLFTTPSVKNADLLDDREGPIIFAANHSSHFDTILVLATLPKRFRHHSIIVAGADYWFDTLPKARFAAGCLNIIPIERKKVDRRSADLALSLLREGWNVIIYPEGTRTRDGFASPFQGGAAYLALHANAPVVPIHLEGTRRIFGAGASSAHPGPTRVVFGNALLPEPGERTRRFNERLQYEVSVLADEGRNGWWISLRNKYRGTTPPLQGPPGLKGWRRNWLGSARLALPAPRRWPF